MKDMYAIPVDRCKNKGRHGTPGENQNIELLQKGIQNITDVSIDPSLS